MARSLSVVLLVAFTCTLTLFPRAAHADTAANVAAGLRHACAVTTGGAVQCWGDNFYGQLGDGHRTNSWTPVSVTGWTSGVAAVAAGSFHTCAVTTAGAALRWGSNDSGQLGDGTTTHRWTPVAVTGLASGVAVVAAGSHHTCAVTTTGGVLCWGANDNGQLGDGTTTARSTPAAVVGLASGVAAVAASRTGSSSLGSGHTCAVTIGGAVLCWGFNSSGQLGDGTTTDRSTPVDVMGLASGVTAVTTGFDHTCALTTAGGVLCWGANSSGQLGDGTTTDRSTPVAVLGLAGGVATVVAGSSRFYPPNPPTSGPHWGPSHTCVLTTGGGGLCWGGNADGQLGDGTTTNRSTPVGVLGLAGGVTAVATGGAYGCAVTTGGAVQCWGDNSNGQLGDGSRPYRSTPVSVAGLGRGGAGVAAGLRHTCAVTTVGAALCWGSNASGTPVAVAGLASGVVTVAVGGYETLIAYLRTPYFNRLWVPYSCALTTTGAVLCWGDNPSAPSPPAPVTVLADGVAAVTAGYGHTCAVTTTGGVLCWGVNSSGQLGDGTQTDRSTPAPVMRLTSGVSAVVPEAGRHGVRAIFRRVLSVVTRVP